MTKLAVILAAAGWLAAALCGSAACRTPTDGDFFVRAGLLVDGLQGPDSGSEPVTVKGAGDPPGQKSAVRAMLLSALLPGLGEVYAAGTRGYVTGSVMAAADVFSFWQYLSNNGKGDTRKDSYESFAARHYDRERLTDYVRETIAIYSGSDSLGFCRPGPSQDDEKCAGQIDRVFPLSKVDDNDFYQQIDAEDRYIFGWDDWNTEDLENPEARWTGWNPGDPIPEAFLRDAEGHPRSANRVTYREIRQEADDFYSKADKYAWVMVIGRIVSIVDSAILVKMRNRDLAGFGTNTRLVLDVDPVGKPDMKLSLKVRF